jgi:hypothetical protein
MLDTTYFLAASITRAKGSIQSGLAPPAVETLPPSFRTSPGHRGFGLLDAFRHVTRAFVRDAMRKVVGATGFEPATPCAQAVKIAIFGHFLQLLI